MSYSRWSHSEWYTYWACSRAQNADEERFAICGVKEFTFKELIDDIDGCLREVEGNDELRSYMGYFIEDVSAKYAPNSTEKLAELQRGEYESL